ncbi:MAG: hypothetical protein ACK4MI_03675 [Brevundimonas sp.]|uniref:hypothetical protein n=1 Tax=Brevundimonas sp. TaxID=1871086 RepID=UPI00391B3961
MSRIILDVGPITRIRAVERAVAQLLSSTIVGTGGVVVTGNPEDGFSLSVPFANPFEVIAYNDTKAVTAAGIKPLIDAVSQSVISTAGLATGGGQVGAGVSINVPKASQFDFIAYDDSKALTSLIVKGETDQKLNRAAKATGAEAIAGTDVEKWVGPYALKQALNAKIVEVAASENPDLEAIQSQIEDRMATDFGNAAFDPTGNSGAARGDLSNTRALGVLVKAPSGTADCYQAIMDASERLNGKPGRIIMPSDRDCYLRSPLPPLPDGQVLQGWCSWGSHVFENTDVMGPKLWVDPDVSITVGNGGGCDSLPVLRAGLTFGQTSAQRYATWLGTAFLLKESSSDHVFKNMAILGFLNGIQSENTTAVIPAQNITNNRSLFERLLMNNINEIWLHNSADIARFIELHLWPAAQLAAPQEAGAAHIKSTGTGVKLTGLNDHTELTRVFAYGKYRGFDLVDVANASLVGCSSDYPPGNADASLGLSIRGASIGVQVDSFRASGMDYGIEIKSTATDGLAATITAPSIWGVTTHAIRSLRGDVQIVGGGLREDGNVAQGVVTGPTSGVTTLIGTDIRGFSTGVSNHSAATVTRLHDVAFSNNTVDVNNPYTDTRFTSFTPVVTCGVGAFGTPAPSATCQYTRDGDDVRANYNITIPANGTADGDIQVTLPITPGGDQFVVGLGREIAQGQGVVVGTATSGSNVMSIVKGTSNTYPAVSGSVLVLSVAYKA